MIKSAFIYLFTSLSLFFVSGAILHHYSESGHSISETYSYAKSLRLDHYDNLQKNLSDDLSFFTNLKDTYRLPSFDDLSVGDSILTSLKFLLNLFFGFFKIIYYGLSLFFDPLIFAYNMFLDCFDIGFYFFFG